MKEFSWEVNRDPKEKTVHLQYCKQTFGDFKRPAMQTFKDQLKFMRAYLDQRPDRMPEIVTQLGFPTPYFTMILGLQATPNRYTLELITITQVLAAHVAMVAKHHLACRRPDRIGAEVMPMIPTPAHASFPSAHSTEAFAVAEVLCGLVDSQKENYADFERRKALIRKLAERIAVNRTVAGLHYPIDTWAGAIIGRAVGQIVLAKCKPEAGPKGQVNRYRYRAVGDKDFFVKAFLTDDEADTYGVKNLGDTFPVGPSDLFGYLWKKVCDEFDLHNKHHKDGDL
jgi:hypothetical protein